MSTPKQRPFAISASFGVSRPAGQLNSTLCALTQLNVDACRSAVTGAALHWDNVLRAQTPEQFVRRQAEMMPWLALQFAGYARGWTGIALETAGLGHAARDHDDGHDPQAGSMPAGMSVCATGVGAMMRKAVPPQVLADGESDGGHHAREMTRAILERAAKADSDTAKRQSPTPARRSSNR